MSLITSQEFSTEVVVSYNPTIETTQTQEYTVIDTPSISSFLAFKCYDTTSLSSFLATQQVILDEDKPVVILFNTCEQ